MFLAFALTKDLLILKPILIACITSFLVARSFNENSIYERQMGLELSDSDQTPMTIAQKNDSLKS